MTKKGNYSEEDKLREYVESQENLSSIEKPIDAATIKPDQTNQEQKEVVEQKATPLPIDRQPNVADSNTAAANTPVIEDTSEVAKPWMHDRGRIETSNRIGLQPLPIDSLPTMGMFYPEGTEIHVRAAQGEEIRHWSTLNEEDLARLDDMLNYILQRCAFIKFPNNKHSSWQDIKEIDRFYILLAIRELTFPEDSGNNLKVKVSETKKISVVKEMIDYVKMDERLMKHYDPALRLYNLQFKDGTPPIKVSMPSVGVTNWLKNYVIRKRTANEPMDEDFITFAPFVITDWRGLNDNTYEQYVMDSMSWNSTKVSVLAHIKQLFAETVNPVVTYQDETGGERRVPLNFQGGIKSLFLIPDPLGQLV